MSAAEVLNTDCLTALRDLPDASVDAVVTDPPYGLSNTTPDQVAETITRWVSGDREYLPSARGFMGHEWDGFVPPVAVWDECLRVLKPGGHLLAFAGSRTQDLMGLAVRLAGFEIRDSVAWLYGSGFPKSMDVSKAIDKLNGRKFEDRYALGRHIRERRIALGLTPADVNAWFGYKDGCQHWERQDPSGARVPTLADWAVLKSRLGLSDEHLALVERVEAEREVVGQRDVPVGHAFAGTTYGGDSANKAVSITASHTDEAKQWEGWGTALKPAFEPVTLARKPLEGTVAANVLEHETGALNIDACRIGTSDKLPAAGGAREMGNQVYGKGLGVSSGRSAELGGRWPANVVLDESQAAELDRQSGTSKSPTSYVRTAEARSRIYSPSIGYSKPGDVALNYGDSGGASRFFYVAKAPKSERPVVDGTAHPTVKPLALMRWLVRMVTPPGGTVLDPFAGSGTTLEAAMLEGFNVTGIEREADYLPLIHARIDRATAELEARAEADADTLFPIDGAAS